MAEFPPAWGEAYAPTVIGPDGTVYAINDAILLVIGPVNRRTPMFRLAALMLFAFPGWAGLIVFGLSPSLVQGPPGGVYQPSICQNQDGSGACLIFNGTIAFTNDQDYFLTGLTVDMDPGNIDGGAKVFANDLSNYFFLNVPGLLGPDGPGATYTGGIFEIDIASDALPGLYLGTATLDYSDSGGNPFTSAAQGIVVEVTPEPGLWPLTAGGLAGLLCVRRRKVRGAARSAS